MSGSTFTIYVGNPTGTPIPITVTKKRVKNFNLRITSTGEVHASAPLRASRSDIEGFIERHRPWIIERLAHQAERQASRGTATGLAPDTLIPLWGEPVSVADALVHNFDGPSPRRQETFASFIGVSDRPAAPVRKEPPKLNGVSPERLADLLTELYRSEAARVTPDIIRKYERAMGVSVTRCSIRSMKTRWGSCTPKTGAIRIALELAQYPIECLDMVVAHELVHLMEPSHNARFHMLLDSYCPGNRAVAQRLKLPPAAL